MSGRDSNPHSPAQVCLYQYASTTAGSRAVENIFNPSQLNNYSVTWSRGVISQSQSTVGTGFSRLGSWLQGLDPLKTATKVAFKFSAHLYSITALMQNLVKFNFWQELL